MAIQKDATINVIMTDRNPKRAAAKDRFALYRSGMTVAEYLTVGGKKSDVAFDAKKGYITLS
jgi:hypothetical protein